MGQIAQINARQILDSVGNPTLEVDVMTTSGIIGRASVPSAINASLNEAVELRDGDQGYYFGKGVLKAVENVNTLINEQLNGFIITEQAVIDDVLINLDGTENKSKLGANTIFGVSLAVAKAAAQFTSQPLFRYLGGVNACVLPIPMITAFADRQKTSRTLDFSECMILPVNAPSFSDALRMGTEIFQKCQELLQTKLMKIQTGSSGNFIPDFTSGVQAVEMILEAAESAGYKAGTDIFLALDIHASSLFNEKKKKYSLPSARKEMVAEQWIAHWKKFTEQFPVVSLIDGMASDDWEGWRLLTHETGDNAQITGGELFDGNISRFINGIEIKAANSIQIKLGQTGTLTETIDLINLAKNNAMYPMISYRTGETDDIAAAELAVALNTGVVRIGPVLHNEHISKYNQLLRIEEMLGTAARYHGPDFRFIR